MRVMCIYLKHNGRGLTSTQPLKTDIYFCTCGRVGVSEGRGGGGVIGLRAGVGVPHGGVAGDVVAVDRSFVVGGPIQVYGGQLTGCSEWLGGAPGARWDPLGGEANTGGEGLGRER